MTLKPRKRPDANEITAVALRNAPTPTPTPRAVEALRTAQSVNPRLPPAEVMPEDRTVNHNMRLRKSTLLALGKAAEANGMTVKQYIMTAIAEKGIAVAQQDLENGKVKPWLNR